MIPFYPTVPVLSPAAMRRLVIAEAAVLGVAGWFFGWVIGPGLKTAVFMGCVWLIVAFVIETFWRRWANTRAWAFVSRSEWKAARSRSFRNFRLVLLVAFLYCFGELGVLGLPNWGPALGAGIGGVLGMSWRGRDRRQPTRASA